MRLFQEIQQLPEVIVSFSGKPDDERTADAQLRAHTSPLMDAGEGIFRRSRSLHLFKYALTAVLERDVEVRQNPILLGDEIE